MAENPWKRLLHRGGQYYWENVAALKALLARNRGYAWEPPRGEHVILLCSGGMDSTVLVDWVIRHWDCRVILLYFRRHSKNQRWEEEAVDFFHAFYRDRYPAHVVELVKLDVEVPSRLNKEYMDRERQAVFMLPMRNATLWTNAFTQAVYLSGKYDTTIRTVLVGSICEDLTTPESGVLALLAGTVLACVGMGLWFYQLLAPYYGGYPTRDTAESAMDKVALLQYAREHAIPVERSRSCFGATEDPCNECLACINRNKAYARFQARDASRAPGRH